MSRQLKYAFSVMAVSTISLVAAAPAHAGDSVEPVQGSLVNNVSFAPAPETSTFTPYLFESNPSFSTTLATAAALQNDDEGRSEGFGIGAKVGPVFAKITGDDLEEDIKNRTGFMAGIWFGGNRGGRVGVMGELMYIEKGAKADVGDDELKLKYLEIPILLRINIGSRSKNGLSVYGLVGPSANIKLGADFNGVDVKDSYEGFDIDVIGGVGVEFMRFLAEFRYDKGLRNVNKGDLGDTTEIHSEAFEFLVGLRFN
jgi:hypothetical protein